MTPHKAVIWLKRLRYLSWMSIFGLPIYSAISYTGIYRIVAELQSALFGTYMGLVSFAVSLLILSIPGIYLSGRIDALSTRGMAPEQIAAYYKKAYIGDLDASMAFRRRLHRNKLLLLSIFALVGGITAGSYFVALAHFSGTLATIDVERLYADQAPPSRFVEARGYADTAALVAVKTKSRNGTEAVYYYFPFLPRAGAAQQQRIQVIVKVRGKFRYDEIKQSSAGGRAFAVKGVLSGSGDNFAVNRMRQRGMIVPENAWILEDGESPENYRNLGLALVLVLGGLGASGTAGILLFRRRQARKAQ